MGRQGKTAKWLAKDKKFVREKGTKYSSELLPILQNLTALGFTESDVGVIAGYQGKRSRDWLDNLKKHYPDVKLACQAGAQLANINLVSKMYQAAVGYDYVEKEQEYTFVQDPKDATKTKRVLVKEKEKTKHNYGSPHLAMFLACNRMPEYFSNRVEITKKGLSVHLDGELSGAQIERLAGKLIEAAVEKKEDSKLPIEPEKLADKKVLHRKPKIIVEAEIVEKPRKVIECKVIDSKYAKKEIKNE